jgi:Tfp pilus assembly protein PilO
MNRRVMVFTGLGLLAVLVLWYAALWAPATGSLSDAEQRLERAESEARTLRLQVSKKADGNADAQRQLDEQAATAAQLVPDQADLDDVLDQLATAATRSGVVLQSVNPSPPAKPSPGDPPTIAVTVQAQGAFGSVQAYLAALEALPRLFVVDSVAISTADGGATGSPVLSATISGRAFATQMPPDLKPTTPTTTAPAEPPSTSGK